MTKALLWLLVIVGIPTAVAVWLVCIGEAMH